MATPTVDYEFEAEKLLYFAGHKFMDKHDMAAVLGHTSIASSAFRKKVNKMLEMGLIEKGKNGTYRVCVCRCL
jgi:hypothetical protein